MNTNKTCRLCILTLAVAAAVVFATTASAASIKVELHTNNSATTTGDAGAPRTDTQTVTHTVNSTDIIPRKWENNVPLEANWNNNNRFASWNRATSVSGGEDTSAEAKCKGGYDANGSAAGWARSQVVDNLDNNLGDNGATRSGNAYARTCIPPPMRAVMITGPGGPGSVNANVTTHAYMAAESDNPDNKQTTSMTANTILPANTVFQFGIRVESRTKYPALTAVPGSIVGYSIYVDDSVTPHAEGSAQMEYDQQTDSVILTTSGQLSGASFNNWTTAGVDGEWWETEGGKRGFYGAISTRLELPDGYKLVPEPATMSLLAIGGLALIRRRRRR